MIAVKAMKHAASCDGKDQVCVEREEEEEIRDEFVQEEHDRIGRVVDSL